MSMPTGPLLSMERGGLHVVSDLLLGAFVAER